MLLKEIMTRDVDVVNAGTMLREAAAKMKALDVGVLPVADNGLLAGILTDRDITVRATADGRDPNTTKVTEVMSTDLVYCLEDQEVEEAVSVMEARQIRRVPVLNEEKRLVGIVSLADIAIHAGDRNLAGETLQEVSKPAEPKR
ncbi:MAG TPA: CBS domain-containing protein [Candidatus Binatia bacterium]|jgi:CBS domain-containing protein